MGDNRGVSPSPSLHDHAARCGADPDGLCAAAVSTALTAAVETAETGTVGDHIGVVSEGDRVVTHFFACEARGYCGWRWAVTVARAPRARTVTVSEVVLLPGSDAVLAPEWVPWSDRIAPGDLGASDALPYREADPFLEPGYTVTSEDDEDAVALWELGLGRARVLSSLGRDAAATRWYLGDRGPSSDEAVNAKAACASCGYFLPLAGGLRQLFGVCANEWSPSDGRVVSVDHGCGAHSETDIERFGAHPLPEPILDETGHVAVVIDRRPDLQFVREAELEPEPAPRFPSDGLSEAEAVERLDLDPGIESTPAHHPVHHPVQA
jgi:hypothetical protein